MGNNYRNVRVPLEIAGAIEAKVHELTNKSPPRRPHTPAEIFIHTMSAREAGQLSSVARICRLKEKR